MAQLKRYNGTSWETIGGSIAPKNTHTVSTTDTYSCNYINDLNTYSTSETRIGTWLGKPLYRKVFTVPNIENVSSGSYASISTGLTNNENVVKTQGQLYRIANNNNKISLPLPYADDNTQLTYLFATNNTNLRVYIFGTNYSGEVVSAYVVCEYTKTTD